MAFELKKFIGHQRQTKKHAALQIGSKGIELVTHRRLQSSFDWFLQSMLLFTLHTFAIDEDGRIGWCHLTVRISKTKRQRSISLCMLNFYDVQLHLDGGANQGETPGIGESPSNQPISGPVVFSKRQALSRAVVVKSNLSRGKYLAREGPGSRLCPMQKSMLGEKSLTWRGSLFLRREVRTVLTTPSLLSASHSKRYWGSDKCEAVFRSFDDLSACFCTGELSLFRTNFAGCYPGCGAVT